MDHIAQPTWGATLDRWFARLDTEKFRTGVRERLLAQSLLSRLAARGELPATQKEMLALAAPLLCTTREQQRRYATLLDDFVAAGERQQGGGGGAGGEGRSGSGADDDGMRRGPFELPPQRLAALIVALVVVLALALWWSNRPPAVTETTTQGGGATQVDPAASGPAASAPVRPFYVPPLPLPLQPPLPPAWSAPLRASLIGLGALALAPLLWAAWARQRRQMALQGVVTGDEVEHHLLNDVAPVDVAPHPMLTRAVARALRQRVAGEARVMDVGATLQATAAARGAFSPRWRELRRTPEYLVLIDTRDAADHHAAYAIALVNALKVAGVSVQVHRYDTTPASGCWASGAIGNDDIATRQKVPLALLATRSAHQRLLIFGSADALLHPVTGEAQPWLASLRVLSERAWFTPQPIHAWGPAEQAADAAGFLVLPLQEAALPTLAGWLTSERLTLALDIDSPQTFPALLRGSALDWVSRADAPPADALEALVQQLRAMLGGERFQWLCACAVFPALTPPLTLALGQRVLADPGADMAGARAKTGGAGADSVDARADAARPPAANPRALALGLAALSALPWFRYGRMPAWLRRELLQRLAPDLRAKLDDEVRERLDAALAGGDGPVLADIATRRRRLLAALQRRHGPLRDVVLADFIRRGSDTGLAQRLPEGLRRRLFSDGDPSAGWRPGIVVTQAVVVALALFAVTPLWQLAVGTTAQPAVARLTDVRQLEGQFLSLPLAPDLALVSVGETWIGLRSREEGVERTRFADDLVSGNGPSRPSYLEALASVALPMPERNPSGLTIVLSSSGLQLRDADDRPVGAPFDTGGLAPRLAAFTPSGSRVVALLADGTLRAWGRPWPEMAVDVVGCEGEDPAAGGAGVAVRAITAQAKTFVATLEATAYTRFAWGALPDREGTPFARSTRVPGVGSTMYGSSATGPLTRLSEILGGIAQSDSTTQELTLPPNRIAIGTCFPSAVSDPIESPPAIEGLDEAAQAELLQRVNRMFDIDADTRKSATAALMTDPERYSDAVPLAIWRAMRAQSSRGQTTTASMSGVINVLVLLQSASFVALNRERAAIDQLIAAVRGNGPQTQEQIVRLQKRRDAAAKARPLISTQIAGQYQRLLAERVEGVLALRTLGVAGIEVIGDRAPIEPQLRIQGASDRLTARRLRDLLQNVLQRPVALVTVASRGDQDTYEIWIDRGACASRQVTGCAGLAGYASAPLPVPASAPASLAQGTAPVPPSPVQSAAPSVTQTAATANRSPVPLSYVPTPEGLDLIARFEGFRAQPSSSGSFQTIGFGHRLTPVEIRTGEIDLRGETVAWARGLTEAQGRRLLQIDLQRFAEQVRKLVYVPLSPTQLDALVSFAYNVGAGSLASSTLLKKLNAGQYDAVADELANWTRGSSPVYSQLQVRRRAEADLWNLGSASTSRSSAAKK